jgi:hypothetical protein
MKFFKKLLLSLAALTATTASATSHMFYDSLLIPGENDPAYKKALYNATGTGALVEIFGGYWGIDNQAPGYSTTNYLALLFAQADQRLIKNEVNGGTWFNFAVAGSWGLDHDSASKVAFYDGGLGICTGQHTDSVGPAGLYIMNATVRQYFNNKRTALSVGGIWMSMYFDRINHARFANDAFEKSPVLPMYYGTPGAVLQHEIDQSNFVTAAFIGTGLGLGDNFLNWNNTNGYAVVVEYGHRFHEGKGTWRVAPFFCSMDYTDLSGRESNHNDGGIMTGVEYDVNDQVKVYARLACATTGYQRARKEAMLGTTLRLVASRPQDYFGACIGAYKGADKYGCRLVNAYEKVMELTYRVQLNDYLSVAPFYQLYIDPAYRDTSTVSATGLQAHLLF